MSILVSQGINTLLFICRDHEVNVVDLYDNVLHCHNLEFNYDCITLYWTSSHKLDHSARFSHDNKLFPGSQPAVDVTEHVSAKKTSFENFDHRGCFR